MPLTLGTRLGPYEIAAPLGAGGMGEVYRARDARLDRDVAVKVLPSQLSRNPQALARFEREAKAIAALSHPNILAIFDVGADGDVHYVVTELLEGETLRSRLQRGPLPWREAMEAATAIAAGLAAAHAKGITHRDMKPDNIFLTASGVLKILDFGLARVEHADSAPEETMTLGPTESGTILGTFGYMSPEQARGATAGPASDIFSCGCVLYEAVSGRRAFHGATAADSLSAVLRDHPPAISAQTPTEVKRLISRCLEKDPTARYPTGRELAEALKIVMSASAESSKPANTIAVLPFVNASRDPDGEYLSDGIAESIINSLSRVSQIKVMPRSTVFRYKGQDADPQSIGRELHVRVVLTGRVIQRGDTLVVSTELIDVAEGMQLWGERYNRKVSDIFELEEEIARKISESLRVTLTGEDQKRLAKRHTENSEAYQLYLKGRHHWARRTRDQLLKAADYFQQAIDKDPGYALAYSGLADCYSILTTYVFVPPREGWARAKAAAAAAVAMDPDLAEAHASLGFIRVFGAWDAVNGEQEFRRAIELNPGYAVGHYWYALLLVALGRLEEAEQQYQLSLEAEPLSPMIAFGGVLTSLSRRRFDEAIDRALKGLEIDPGHPTLRMWLGISYQQKGNHAEALAEFEAIMRLLPDTGMGVGGLGHELGMTGDHETARRLLGQALEHANRGLTETLSLAIINLGLGEIDEVFRWLNVACEARCGLLYFVIKCDPRFDPLRSDPRFAEVLERMGLSQ